MGKSDLRRFKSVMNVLIYFELSVILHYEVLVFEGVPKDTPTYMTHATQKMHPTASASDMRGKKKSLFHNSVQTLLFLCYWSYSFVIRYLKCVNNIIFNTDFIGLSKSHCTTVTPTGWTGVVQIFRLAHMNRTIQIVNYCHFCFVFLQYNYCIRESITVRIRESQP